MFEVNVIETGK